VAARHAAGDELTKLVGDILLVVGGVFREVLYADTTPRLRYGGSGLTAAIAAARLGANVSLAAAVGADDVDAVTATLEEAGVATSSLVVTRGASGTFLFPSFLDGAHPWPLYRPAESAPQAAPALPVADVALCFGVPDLDHLADGWLAGVTTKTLLWDRQGWLSRARDASGALSVAAGRHVYVANRAEAADDIGDGGGVLTQPPVGFAAALIKDGRNGVTVVEGSATGHVPAATVATAQTIGSGDVFGGAAAAALAEGASLIDAARIGCAAAAVSLRRGDNLLQSADDDAVRELAQTLH
jgi:sugar/nucleoside kinase (ribokinase family)